jgi:hypothetical protein
VIKFVSDLRQVSGFLRFPPPIKLTANYRIGKPRITFIRYAQNYRIGKANKLKVFGPKQDCQQLAKVTYEAVSEVGLMLYGV